MSEIPLYQVGYCRFRVPVGVASTHESLKDCNAPI